MASLEEVSEKEWVQARVAGLGLECLQEVLTELLSRSGHNHVLALEQNTAAAQGGEGYQQGGWAELRGRLSQVLDRVFVKTCTVALGVWEAAENLR